MQLRITSLPGGTLGREAFRFIDWLAEAGQSWWQVLPLGPPDRHGSPYKSGSAFAAWPGLLDSGARRSRVRASEIAEFSELHAYWAGDWQRLGGRGAVADQVRFQREWQAVREYAAERRVLLLGDVAIYVAPGSVDHRAHPEPGRFPTVPRVRRRAAGAAGQDGRRLTPSRRRSVACRCWWRIWA